MDTDADYRMKEENSELSSISDKLIRYDSKFKIRNPKLSTNELRINLHIDLEGQKSYRPSNPSYPIIKRALYYAARNLSAQLGTVTGTTDYSKLEKCYSIWICNDDIPKRLQNTMTEYAIKKRDFFSETNEPESDYDLMTVIIIRRGKETDGNSIFDYLNGVFNCDIKKIENYSHIEWTESFRKEVHTMTGFGDALIEKGIQKGRKEEKDALIWNMYIKNFSIAQIADITNDSIDYIKEVLSAKSKESLNQ